MPHLENATLRLVLLFLASTLLGVASCSAPSPDEGASVATAEAWTTSQLQLCPGTASYIVLSPADPDVAPACPGVPGDGGDWLARPAAEPLLCTPVTDTAQAAVSCTYDWSPSDGAAPDLGALQSLPGVYLASIGDGGGAACKGEEMLRYVTLLDLAGVKCPLRAGGGPNAPKGCDVCGRGVLPGVLRDQLVIPPSTSLHTLAVAMSNGTQQVVTVSSDRAGLRSRSRGWLVSLPLPELPYGVSYVDGPALGYGYQVAAPSK